MAARGKKGQGILVKGSSRDPKAIHTDKADEISGLTEKGTPVSGDLLVVEDSAASNVKKKVQVGNLPGGTDADAIHDNVAAEISAVTEKAIPADADLILIEDSAASNAKKRVQMGNIPKAPMDATYITKSAESGLSAEVLHRFGATLLVASNTATNKELADYVCDGTDDDIQIQAAIDALEAASGGRVMLTEGTFNCTATLTIEADHIRLEGQGHSTIIDATGHAGNAIDYGTSAATVYATGISNLRVEGDSGNAHGIYMQRLVFWDLTNVAVVGFSASTSYAVYIKEKVWSGAIQNPRWTGNYNGFRIGGDSGQTGSFVVHGGEITTLQGATNDSYSIHASAGAGAIGNIHFAGVNLPGNGGGSGAKGIYLEQGFNYTFENMEIEGRNTTGTPYGIYASNVTSITILSCYFLGFTQYPIYIANSVYVAVVGGNEYDQDVSATAFIRIGSVIQPTTFANFSDAGVPTYDYTAGRERLVYVFSRDFDTAGIKINDCLYDMEVIDVWVHCTETNSSGTVQLLDASGGNAITDAIACDTDHAMTRVGTIDDTHSTLTTTDDLYAQPANNAKGTIYVAVFG